MIPFEYLALGVSILLLLSVLASKASGWLGIPALLVFLAIGMLAGSDGLGGVYFDDARLAQSLGVLALILIVFAGGMDTDWKSVSPVLGPAAALSTLGVIVTALLVGGFAALALGLAPLEGILLGAIVSSTDAAAVFAVLRSRGIALRDPLKPLLELESGSNDPMAVFLTVFVIELVTTPVVSVASLIPGLALQFGLGGLAGFALGRATVLVINRVRLEYEGLYPVLTLSAVLLIYGLTTVAGGSGILAVYIAALVIGNSDFVHKRSLLRFHDGLAWLMQIAMFLTLGLLVFPSRLISFVGPGLLITAFLMLAARPASVFLVLAFTRLNLQEKALVAWVGLRGAVPIILATFPLLAALPRAEAIFNTVFFIVLASVLLQGTTIPQVAKWLKVDARESPAYHYPLEFVPAPSSDSRLVELNITSTSPFADRSIMDLHLPRSALVVSVQRDGDHVVPSGATVIRPGDTVLLLVDDASWAEVRSRLEPGPDGDS